MIDIYINSACTISPQNTFYKKEFLKDIVRYKGHLTCIEPDYREYLPSIPLRRMSHILKMGVTSAQQCLKEGEVEQPDAINIGTGLGCVYNTEKFLNKMLDNNEALLSPTDFIQSTHNIIGSQIAMMLNCNSHNV